MSQSEYVFTGRWRIIRLEANVVGQGWTLLKEYEPDEFIWEFEYGKTTSFPKGDCAHEGKLIEKIKDQTDFKTTFSFYPQDNKIYIDRSDYLEDGFCNICINDIYRVELISPTKLWIYDLEDVDREPQDYRFRIKISKHYQKYY